MTETDWLTCSDPARLAEAVLRWGDPCRTCHDSGRRTCPSCHGGCVLRRVTPRKLRLLACACCRAVWDHLGGPDQAVIELAERFAEGRAEPGPLARAGAAATAAVVNAAALPEPAEAALAAIRLTLAMLKARHMASKPREVRSRLAPTLTAACLAAQQTGLAVAAVGKAIERRIRRQVPREIARARVQDARDLSDVVRDLFGNPYRRAVLDPAWLDGNGGLARLVARDIEASGNFDEVPVLGDALQEAGCTDERVLAHARLPGHYRGCWLIDAVLNRE